MHTLYDSDTFSVTHMLANAPEAGTASAAPSSSDAKPVPMMRSIPSSLAGHPLYADPYAAAATSSTHEHADQRLVGRLRPPSTTFQSTPPPSMPYHPAYGGSANGITFSNSHPREAGQRTQCRREPDILSVPADPANSRLGTTTVDRIIADLW